MFDALPFDPTTLSGPQIVAIVTALAALLLLVQSALSALQTYEAQRTVNRRLKFKDQTKSTEELIIKLRRQRALDEKGDLRLFSRRLNELVLRSGLEFQPLKWAAISALVATVLFGVIFLRFDQPLIGAGIGVASFFIGPLAVLKMAAGKRKKKLSRQLPDALQIVTRSLEAGHPVPTAIGLVARETPDPIGTEFGMAADEIAYGHSLTRAIERMAMRCGDEDIELFAATVRLQERTGGNLCDLLKTNVKAVRERQTLRLKVKAASAEGRASALILTSAPFIVMAAIHFMRPEFYGLVWEEKLFQYGLAGLGTWMLIGNIIMNKMINFRF